MYRRNDREPIKDLEISLFNLIDLNKFNQLLNSTILCRHGKTHLNEKRVIQGCTNTKLSTSGTIQIQEQSNKLNNSAIKIQGIFTSEMIRAKQTAHIFSDKRTTQVVISNMHEYNYGDWEGIAVSEILSDPSKELWTMKRITKEQAGPKNGESFIEFLTRINQCLANISNQISPTKTDEKYLIICHAEVLRAIRFLHLLSGDGKPATMRNLIELENNFSFDLEENFIKVPHGLIKLSGLSFKPFL